MVASIPTLSIFTGTESFGTVFREQNQINVKFWDGNIPGTTTSGRTSLQILGKTRIILVQGAHSGSGYSGATDNAKLAAFIADMESWVNAAVQTAQVYTDSLGNTYNVDAVDWTWSRSFDDLNRVLYTLIMKES